jgi:hypothetical protein
MATTTRGRTKRATYPNPWTPEERQELKARADEYVRQANELDAKGQYSARKHYRNAVECYEGAGEDMLADLYRQIAESPDRW